MYHTKTSHESLSCNSKLQSMHHNYKGLECILTMQFSFHVPCPLFIAVLIQWALTVICTSMQLSSPKTVQQIAKEKHTSKLNSGKPHLIYCA